MAHPFPYYYLEQAPLPMCPLPDKVDEIKNSLQCHAAMAQCQIAAGGRALTQNDPTYHEYAQWFGRFNHQQQSDVVRNHLGQSQTSVWSGCHLLDTPAGRKHLWPVAKEHLKNQLYRFHANRGSTFATSDQPPTVKCSGQGADVMCGAP